MTNEPITISVTDAVARADTLTDTELSIAKQHAYAAQRAAEAAYKEARERAKAIMDASIATEREAQARAQREYNILSHQEIERARGVPITWQAVSAALRAGGIPRRRDPWGAPNKGEHSTSKHDDYTVDVTLGSADSETREQAEGALMEAGYAILSTQGRRTFRVVRLKAGQTLDDLRRRSETRATRPW